MLNGDRRRANTTLIHSIRILLRTTEEVWGRSRRSWRRPGTQEVSGATREIGSSANENARSNIYSEAPTRRYDNLPLDSPYPSIFVPPTYSQPAPYQPACPRTISAGKQQKPTSRTVAGIGLPEKWAMMLPYAPFYIGVVVSLLELFLVPRKEAAGAFSCSTGARACTSRFWSCRRCLAWLERLLTVPFGGSLFGLAATIFLVVSMIRVWKGEPHHIAPIAEPAQWFNEHIEPRNKS